MLAQCADPVGKGSGACDLVKPRSGGSVLSPARQPGLESRAVASRLQPRQALTTSHKHPFPCYPRDGNLAAQAPLGMRQSRLFDPTPATQTFLSRGATLTAQ